MDLKEIITKHGSTVRNIIQRITNEQNEDLEQEVYTKIWKNSDKYQEKGVLNAWIRTISANLPKDYLKSSQKKLSDNTTNDETVLSFVADRKETPESLMIKRERQQMISEAINKLKPKFREVIMLYEIENKSYEEISQKIKCPIGTVKSRLYNAKKELAVMLENLI